MAHRRLLLLVCLSLATGCLLVVAQEPAAPGPSPSTELDHADAHNAHADHAGELAPSPAPAEEAAHDHTEVDSGLADADHGSTTEDHDHDHATHADHAAESSSETGADDDGHEHDHAAEDESAATLGTAEEEEEDDDDHAGHFHGGGPCYKIAPEDYNIGLHIGAVFILLGVSMLGAFSPVGLHISSSRRVIQTIIRLGTFFGFGTILSTAFIHMMLPAVEKLSSDCLPESWTGKYEAWGYLFVVIAILGMQLIDYLVELAYARYTARGAEMGELHGAITNMHEQRQLGMAALAAPTQRQLAAGLPGDTAAALARPAGGGPASNASVLDDEEAGDVCPVHGEGCQTLLKHKSEVSQVVSIYLLEAGIVFHSFIIGLPLGMATGTTFTTLLIALAFHQFFEGFAIGSAAVDSGLGAKKSFLMGLIYSLTTPTGIAIGIGVHESYNHNSDAALYVEGILDALSTGILLYAVLVKLLNPMMTQSQWLRSRPWWLQTLGFLSLYGGAAVMAGIGKWA